MDQGLQERLASVMERVSRACERAGRKPGDVTLIAVTKGVPVERVQAAIELGVAHVGENRVQEARDKLPCLPAGVTRHLIGTLQSNKARYVPSLFDWVHSLDRFELAHELGRRVRQAGRAIDCLVQVNVSGEPTKRGVAPGQALELVAAVAQVDGLKVRGLMTIAPLTGESSAARRVFAALRELAQEIESARIPGVSMQHLSMGMSDDFEVAIEEGATMIRIGSAIFGPRA